MNIKKPSSVWEYKVEKFVPKILPISYQILSNRGYDLDEQERFIDINNMQFHDPFSLRDMDKAVSIINEVIDKNERIVVYGDYDVDGITSTSLLYHFFKMINYEVDRYIPDRINEGYGLNPEAIDMLTDKYKLIITVDCGITAQDEIKLIKDKGAKVIITDHHQCGDLLPIADAIINPHLEENYETPFLAGVGVALKLTQGLAKKNNYKQIKWPLLYALAAIGTIADIVPLLNENRLITKLGLEAINNGSLLKGLDTLIKVSGLNKGDIGTGNVAFGLAPRLNAGGRLGSPEDPLNLLITDDDEEAFNLAEHLNIQNEKRKAIEQKILSQALEMIDDSPIYVLYNPEWHHGVLGIVASRIVELTYKPVILLGEGDGAIKGSGRSIKGVHLQKLLLENDEILESHGGHELAAGLSLNEDNLEELRKRLTIKVQEIFEVEEFKPKFKIDYQADVASITYETASELENLGPYGFGNPQPNILLSAVEVVDMQQIGKGKHSKVVVKDFLDAVECLKWNDNDLNFKIGDKIDVLGTISKNEWLNIKSASLVIKDYRQSSKPKLVDRRNISKKELLSNISQENSIIVTYKSIDDFNLSVLRNNMFEPVYLIKKNNEYIHVDNFKENIENVIIYDMPFFANQLNKILHSNYENLVLAYNESEYQDILSILDNIQIDRDYLIKIYQRILSQSEVIIEDSYFKESSLKEAIANHKLFYSLEILMDLGLIKQKIKDSKICISALKNKTNIENSQVLTNYKKLIDRAKKEVKFLSTASEEKIQKYVRRI